MPSITLPVSVYRGGIGSSGNTHMSVEGIEATHVMAENETKAREEIKARILTCLERFDRIEKHYQRRVIGCANGTVLIVRWSHDSWGYDINGAGRKYSSSASSTNKTFEQECAAARAHAENSYGGIVWEN